MLGGLRARTNEIKPDPVDQPERTAHYDCAMCIAEMLHNTIAQLIFPFLQTNITAQMRPSGGWGGGQCVWNISQTVKVQTWVQKRPQVGQDWCCRNIAQWYSQRILNGTRVEGRSHSCFVSLARHAFDCKHHSINTAYKQTIYWSSCPQCPVPSK